MRHLLAFLFVAIVCAEVCVTTRLIYVRTGPSPKHAISRYLESGRKFICDKAEVNGYVKFTDEDEYVSSRAIKFLSGSDALDVVPRSTRMRSRWPKFTKPFPATGKGVKYFLQTDPRWNSVPYSIHNDRRQTIGSSGCGPSCAAMAVFTLTNLHVDPFSAAKFAIIHGDRTYNKGTAYDFFSEYFSSFGLKCSETKDLNEALKALEKPATLVVASVGPGYWTQTGHYILLYAHDKSFVYARDPLHPNRHKTSQETLKKEGIIYFIVSQ